jgi:hypothetical protein
LSVTETIPEIVEAVAAVSEEEYWLVVRSPVLISSGGYR